MLTEGQKKLLAMLRESPEKLGKKMTPAEVASSLNVTTSTLATWRTNTPDRIPFFRTGAKGGRVLYYQYNVDQYIAQQFQGVG